MIEEPDHFGHDRFNSLNRNRADKWINIQGLDTIFAKHGKVEKDGKVVLNLTSLGYNKLLGGGKVESAYALQGTEGVERSQTENRSCLAAR